MARTRLGPLAVLAVAGLIGLSACSSSSSTATSDAEKQLAFSQLPSCPLDALSKAKKPVEITMWTDALVASLNTMNALADKFNKSQSEVKVKIVRPFGDDTSPANVHAAYMQLNGLKPLTSGSESVSLPAGAEIPALVQLSSYRVREMADSGAVLPAQSCINASKFDMSGLSPMVKAYFSIGGVQWPSYVIPSTTLMAYNASQFRDAGLDPSNPPKTLDELEAAARKLKASGIANPICLPNDPDLIVSWLTGAGATLVSDGNGRQSAPTRATFFTQAAVKLYTWLQRMMSEGLIRVVDNSKGQVDYLMALATGTSSVTFIASSGATSVAAVVGGEGKETQQASQLPGANGLGGVATKDYRAGELPGLNAAGQITVRGSAWYISRGVPPEQQAAAWKFTQFIYQPENQLEMLTKFGALPITTDVAKQASVSKFFNEGGLAGRWLGTAQKQFAGANPELPGPLIGPYEDFYAILRKSLDELEHQNGLTPSQILTNAENEFTRTLTAYNTSHG